MVAPSLLSSRRFPHATRQRLTVAFARAWDSLAAAHTEQACRFVQMLAGRLTAEEALQRYLREVTVPALMHETVRARAIVACSELLLAEQEPVNEPTGLWPHELLDAVRRRAAWVDETNLACRLAASLAEEAISARHVDNAIEVAEVLVECAAIDEALMHYVRAFSLPSVHAETVFQRALAALAQRHPLVTPAVTATRQVLTSGAAPSAQLPGMHFGLRVIG